MVQSGVGGYEERELDAMVLTGNTAWKSKRLSFFCLQDPLFKISWLVMLVLTEAGPVSDMSVQKMSTAMFIGGQISETVG